MFYTLPLIPTCHGTGSGMPHVSWFGLWHHVRGRGMRHVSWLSLWHHARGGGTHHVSWLDPWHHARGHVTRHGTGDGMPHMSKFNILLPKFIIKKNQ